MRVVTFSSADPVIHRYAPQVDADVDYFRMAIDRMREEPRAFQSRSVMSSVEQVLRQAFEHRITVIFGNLGQLPSTLAYYIETCVDPNSEVRVLSDFFDASGLDESFEDDGTRCDLLLWLEPNFGDMIAKPPYAARLVVLTSHMNLIVPREARVVAHHVGGDDRVSKRVPMPCGGYVEHASEDWDKTSRYVPDLFVKRNAAIDPESHHVCVDLSDCCKTAREAYLRLLVARFHLESQSILGWKVALKSTVLESLRLNLQMSERRLLELTDVPCNLAGLNLMIRRYVTDVLENFPYGPAAAANSSDTSEASEEE